MYNSFKRQFYVYCTFFSQYKIIGIFYQTKIHSNYLHLPSFFSSTRWPKDWLDWPQTILTVWCASEAASFQYLCVVVGNVGSFSADFWSSSSVLWGTSIGECAGTCWICVRGANVCEEFLFVSFVPHLFASSLKLISWCVWWSDHYPARSSFDLRMLW